VVQNRKPNFDHQKRLETTRKHHFSSRNYNFELFFRASHKKFHEKNGFLEYPGGEFLLRSLKTC
jgi:hypothetical protein